MSVQSSVVSSRFGSKESCAVERPEVTQDGLLPSLGQKSRLLAKSKTVDSSEENFEGGSQSSAGSLKGGRTFSTGSGGHSLVKAALSAGWSKQRLGAGFSDKPPRALERSSADDFSGFVMSQLNQMYAHMEKAMSRERTRHSSDVHLLMRKVDKDLKDTFRSVRGTFLSLTQQVQELLRQVDAGKKSIASIQDKFDSAKASAAIRAQYVEELEAVLDGQVPNISEAMRKLSEDLTTARITADKVQNEAAEKEQAMIHERSNFRALIKSLEERLNEREVIGFAGATELPLLPEMAATWTHRQQRPHTSDATGATSDCDLAAESGVDILGSTMAQSDATRAVTRMKIVRPMGTRPSTTPFSARTKQWSRHLTKSQQQQLEAKVANLKQRLHEAEHRVSRQHRLFLDSAPALQLLREIFSELRMNWRLNLPESDPGMFKDVESLREELALVAKAPDILDHITQLFVHNFSQLGNFSVVLDALCEEAARPSPSLSAVMNNIDGSTPSDGGFSVVSDGEHGHLSPVLDVPYVSSAADDDYEEEEVQAKSVDTEEAS